MAKETKTHKKEAKKPKKVKNKQFLKNLPNGGFFKLRVFTKYLKNNLQIYEKRLQI